jgi:PAS domain S-box-containing protein
MLYFFRQNRNVLLISAAVFIVSMTGLLFFLNNGSDETANRTNQELQTNVVDSFTEKSAQEKEEKYSGLFQGNDSPMVVIKLDGVMEYSNSDYAGATGFTSEELEGQSFFGLIHPEDLPAFLKGFGEVLQSAKPVHMVGPFRMLMKSGEFNANMASLYPVSENEKITRIGVVTKDITDHAQTKNPDKKPEIDVPVMNADSAPEQQSVTPEKEPANDNEPASVIEPAQAEEPKSNDNKKYDSDDENHNSGHEEDLKISDRDNPKSKKSRDPHENPGWIVGEKLVMLLLPLNLPSLTGHLLLARL